MRLTQLKLAGFKSFVDPTTIAIPGNRVGVVGPNGCGKSNLIDAVRWVLGESRASALRGESMQDVIFNGSLQRKPVARASVELVFDNALGRAAGQWSQYAEISVKRVLQRDGESGYFINNTAVRRRDIQDIFLGTGVGPRAYAIIEQGMISRVIEAKPEELRVFLEEAAGISRYKERRRETESRLEDTRENLARVSDVRRELDAQINKLTEQAEVARRFSAMQLEQTEKQHLLWWLRHEEATREAGRLGAELQQVATQIEQLTAGLREIERELEKTRADHYAAGDATNAIQGELYTVNSDIARLESELRHVGETRQRLMAQGMQHIAQLSRWGAQQIELSAAIDMWGARMRSLGESAAQADQVRAGAEAALEGHEQAVRRAQQELVQVRAAIAAAERVVQVEEARRSGALRLAEQVAARTARLDAERAGLRRPEPAVAGALERQMSGYAQQIARMESDLAAIGQDLPKLESQRSARSALSEALGRSLSGLRARLSTLIGLQEEPRADGALVGWLDRHGLANLSRVWQHVSVTPGWERALEAVLRERLRGLLITAQTLGAALADPAPANLALVLPDGQSLASPGAQATGALPIGGWLLDCVQVSEPGLQAVVSGWLSGYARLDDLPSPDTLARLTPGVSWVDRDGRIYESGTVLFQSGAAGDANVLVRKREIERLDTEVQQMSADLVDAQTSLDAAEAALAGARGRASALQGAISRARQGWQQSGSALVRERELHEQAEARAAQIDSELLACAEELARLDTVAQGHQTLALAQQGERARAIEQLQSVQQAQGEAERTLAQRRDTLRQAERSAQEARFAVREADSKLAETRRSLSAAGEQVGALTRTERALRVELGALIDTQIKADLQRRLTDRSEIEQRLARSRDALEAITAGLRAIEARRVQAEQSLGPMRETIADVRLREQAARLSSEQFAAQLAEAGADTAHIEVQAQTGARALKPASLQTDINRLGQQMSALGAINMAALDELATGSERKSFLDAQATDLAEALETLENAIRRIDLETRSLLQQTFDAVNVNFSTLFPALFGGGQARLVMTGDEILDAGVQVMAQPPGKKNASIHLLSGGEKALTAISLIFSLFQLNPAPFCLLDEVDAPLDDANTVRFCKLVERMSEQTQFLFISHNKITMELANQLVGVTMQEQGVSRIVAVDMEQAIQMREPA